MPSTVWVLIGISRVGGVLRIRCRDRCLIYVVWSRDLNGWLSLSLKPIRVWNLGNEERVDDPNAIRKLSFVVTTAKRQSRQDNDITSPRHIRGAVDKRSCAGVGRYEDVMNGDEDLDRARVKRPLKLEGHSSRRKKTWQSTRIRIHSLF